MNRDKTIPALSLLEQVVVEVTMRSTLHPDIFPTDMVQRWIRDHANLKQVVDSSPRYLVVGLKVKIDTENEDQSPFDLDGKLVTVSAITLEGLIEKMAEMDVELQERYDRDAAVTGDEPRWKPVNSWRQIHALSGELMDAGSVIRESRQSRPWKEYRAKVESEGKKDAVRIAHRRIKFMEEDLRKARDRLAKLMAENPDVEVGE